MMIILLNISIKFNSNLNPARLFIFLQNHVIDIGWGGGNGGPGGCHSSREFYEEVIGQAGNQSKRRQP